MKDIKIVPLDIKNDIEPINNWAKEFSHSSKFDSIRHFILEDNTFYGLGEVIYVNFEIIPIGTRERAFAHCFKNDQNKIIGFVLSTVIDLHSKSPELLIQHLVIHPDFQNQGIGKSCISKMINNTSEFFGSDIERFFTKIHKDNIPSQKLFKSLGFKFHEVDGQPYFAAVKKQNILEKE